MYLSSLTIENFRCFGEEADRFELRLNKGLTALVGENEAGKTAVIDALRLVLGTTDQERFWLDDTDFHLEESFREIRIICLFEELSHQDKRTFVEYLTYDKQAAGEPVLYIYWTAKDTGDVYRGRPYRRVEVHSGEDGSGPSLAPEVRELMRATYLRPLRDAEQALSAGRGSRLSQVLRNMPQVRQPGGEFDPEVSSTPDLDQLNVLGIGDLADYLLERQQGIVAARNRIEEHLADLSLRGDGTNTSIKVGGKKSTSDIRLRQLLEKLELTLEGIGSLGLGSDNLLFMACELLLLAEEEHGIKLILIEEPEAHLHAQRQLQVIRFLQAQAREKGIQVIVTTHSPNLASAIDLDNMVMVRGGRAFSMALGETGLEASDYRFLQRFLDVTKANLFFARGVVIVEGDAENILLPALATLLDRDFTKHGVSIVNVGGTGLRRYARIFHRQGKENSDQLDIPVSCVTDMDVMPDCAPLIVGRVSSGDEWPAVNRRRWRAKKDFNDGLLDRRDNLILKASGQYVKTFVADEWTLEYDLALGPSDDDGQFLGGIGQDVYVAARLADDDDAINQGRKESNDVVDDAAREYAQIAEDAVSQEGCAVEEVVASQVYAKFARDGVSKAVAAQYLAERLLNKSGFTAHDWRARLPTYLTQAIDYACGVGNTGILEEAPAGG